MLRTWFVPSLAAAAIVSAAACSSSGDAPDAPNSADSGATPDGSSASQAKEKRTVPDAGAELDPALLPIAKWNKELAIAICGKITECCDTNDYRGYFARYYEKPYDFSVQKGTERVPAPAPKTVAECESVVARQLGLLTLEAWGTTVIAKRMSFDATRAAECTSAIKGVACGNDTGKVLFDNACVGNRYNEVLRKVSPLGAPCERGDGTYYGTCDIAVGYCSDGVRVCKPWAREGEVCGIRSFCAPELDCVFGEITEPPRCKSSVVRALGEDCTKAPDGASPIVCGKGLNCRTDGERRTCVAVAEDGSACTEDSDCRTNRLLSCSPLTKTCGYTFCGGKKPLPQ